MMLKRLLAHPLTKGMDIDSPQTTLLRRRIIREKPFLRKTYEHWYRRIATALPDGDGLVVELGSGGGFMSECIPDLITSDVFEVPGVKTVVDAHALPFADGSLRAIVMTDVLHHIPDVRRFLTEATRCVRAGGAIVMIEPWVTPWARLVWRFHHEAFAPQAPTWSIPHGGALSGANMALPWILFVRDRQVFEQDYPQWRIRSIDPFMPLAFLLSGGVSCRSFAPGWAFGACRWMEDRLERWRDTWAMFAQIVLDRIPSPKV